MSHFSEHDPTRQELAFIDGLGDLKEHGLPRRGWRRYVVRIGLVLVITPTLLITIWSIVARIRGNG